MNNLQRDKCVARRISRAGCVNALGITRVRHSPDDTRVLSNNERVSWWRSRANMPGMHNSYFHELWEKKDGNNPSTNK